MNERPKLDEGILTGSMGSGLSQVSTFDVDDEYYRTKYGYLNADYWKAYDNLDDNHFNFKGISKTIRAALKDKIGKIPWCIGQNDPRCCRNRPNDDREMFTFLFGESKKCRGTEWREYEDEEWFVLEILSELADLDRRLLPIPRPKPPPEGGRSKLQRKPYPVKQQIADAMAAAFNLGELVNMYEVKFKWERAALLGQVVRDGGAAGGAASRKIPDGAAVQAFAVYRGKHSAARSYMFAARDLDVSVSTIRRAVEAAKRAQPG